MLIRLSKHLLIVDPYNTKKAQKNRMKQMPWTSISYIGPTLCDLKEKVWTHGSL